MWAFFQRVFDYLTRDLSDRLDVITQSQFKLETLIMGLKEDLKAFALAVDDATNDIAGQTEQIAVKIAKLQAQLTAGSLTAADLSEALSPVVSKLQVVSANLRAVAADGEPVVPPLIVELPVVEPPPVVESVEPEVL